jgi:hypothetical protein
MFYGQCWKCGERWNLGTASTCTCEPDQLQRTWVGLTEDEAFACKGRDYFETYKAIEAKLKDKNT